MTYAHRVVWITGASSGIGKALAIAFARERARVVLTARSRASLTRVRDECRAYTDWCEIAPIDLEKIDEIPHLVERELELSGGIDLVVHCAGVSQRSTALETDLAVDRRIMDVNFFGTVALTKAVLPSMIASGRGQIAVVSSIVGLFGFPLRSAYAASKHALQGFFETLSMELREYGVGVTIVSPGRIKTDISKHALGGNGEPYGRRSPGQELGLSAERCAKKIVKGVKRNKRAVYVGGRELIMVWLRKWIPPLFFYVARRVKPE
ncbi:MAG: SDR family oxidoreductase [Spirochaetota bacterium]